MKPDAAELGAVQQAAAASAAPRAPWIQNPLSAAVEILILAAFIYAALRFLRSTRGFGVVRGLAYLLILAVVLFAVLKVALGIPVLEEIFGKIIPWLVVIVAVLFQPELRQGISRFGRAGWFGLLARPSASSPAVEKTCAAAQRMAKERVGALIAFERNISLAAYRENATAINAPVSSILIETIFFPGSPLHDGAVIIHGDQIAAAACLFPLAEAAESLARLGTRHRAALGVTEETDAVALVVSEETGQISLCAAGKIYRPIALDQLEERLSALLRAEVRAGASPADSAGGGQPVPLPPPPAAPEPAAVAAHAAARSAAEEQ